MQENIRLNALIQELTHANQQKSEKIRRQANQIVFLTEELKSTHYDVEVLESKIEEQESRINDLKAEKLIHDREFAHLHRKFGGVISNETDNILKCGWGWKLPPTGGSVWQRRFFALFTNRELTYFEEKGSINLLGCSKPQLLPDRKSVV